MAKLKIDRGTTYTRTGTFKLDGETVSLVGATIRFTVKDSEYDSDDDDSTARVKKDIIDGTASGTYSIELEPVDTATIEPGKYNYDTKVELPDGRIYKLDEGTVQLDGSPTNRLS